MTAPPTPTLDRLIAQARHLGATGAACFPATSLVVEDRFAGLCAAPHRCPSYGLAPGCPPHALPPDQFRTLLKSYQWILAFKIDALAQDLIGPARLALARRIHQIAATLEEEARTMGFSRAKGLAAGSCKELFCPDAPACQVLAHALPCPHAHQVRPSISALGIDFAQLAKTVGWPFARLSNETHPPSGPPAMGLMAGLVLLA